MNITGADGVQPIHVAAKYFKAEKHLNENAENSTADTIRKLSSAGMIALAATKFRRKSTDSSSRYTF